MEPFKRGIARFGKRVANFLCNSPNILDPVTGGHRTPDTISEAYSTHTSDTLGRIAHHIITGNVFILIVCTWCAYYLPIDNLCTPDKIKVLTHLRHMVINRTEDENKLGNNTTSILFNDHYEPIPFSMYNARCIKCYTSLCRVAFLLFYQVSRRPPPDGTP